MNEEQATRLNQESHRPKWRSIGAVIFLVFLVIIFLVLVVANSENRYNSDFLKFYLSARFLLAGENIYSPLTLETIPEDVRIEAELFNQPIHANLNPPLLSLVMLPLGKLNYPNAYIAWWVISLALGLISVYWIFNEYHEDLNNLHVFDLSIIFLLFYPTILTFLSGQVSTLLLFLIVVAWVAGRKGNDSLPGIVLGFALSLKIFTGLFIPLFMIQRRWRLLGWYLGTFIVVNLFSLLVVGIDDHIEYLKSISSVTWYSATWNTSIMGFLTRIFGGSESLPLINSPIIGIILYFTLSLIILITLLWLAYKSKTGELLAFDLLFSLTIVCMLLISPLGWIYYYVLLIIPFVVSWVTAKKQGKTILQGLAIAAWLLCSIPYPRHQIDDIGPVDIFMWSGFPFYGLLLMMLVLIVLLSRLRAYQMNSQEPGIASSS